jgi:hypothetical protein
MGCHRVQEQCYLFALSTFFCKLPNGYKSSKHFIKSGIKLSIGCVFKHPLNHSCCQKLFFSVVGKHSFGFVGGPYNMLETVDRAALPPQALVLSLLS